MKRRPRRRLPSHYLADTAVQAVAQGGISATDQAVLYELMRQHGPWLDRRRGLVYRLIGARVGRSHRTIVRSTQHLRAAGLLQVCRRWQHRDGQTRQLPPLYRFPALAGPTPPAYLRVQALLRFRRPSESANMTPTNRDQSLEPGDAASATDADDPEPQPYTDPRADIPRIGGPWIDPAKIREYAAKLKREAVGRGKGRPASGGDPPPGPEGDPSG